MRWQRSFRWAALAAVVVLGAGCTEKNVTNITETPPPAPLSPTLMFVEPAFGPTLGGNRVTLTGLDFAVGTTVAFGATPSASVTVVSGSTVFCDAPASSAGFADVTVTNPDGALTVRPRAYEFRVPPVITAVVPPSGSAAGGQRLEIYGTGFQPAIVLTIGGTAATGLTVNAAGTLLTCLTPAGTPGAATVLVTNPDTLSDTFPFTYVAAGTGPVIGAVQPGAGPPGGGTTVTISGSNFQASGTTQVFFGPNAATGVSVASATSLSATTPAGASGTLVSVSVVNPDGLSAMLPGAFGYDTFGTPPTFAGAAAAQPVSPYAISVSWGPATDNVTPPARILYQAFAATSSGGQNLYGAPTLQPEPGAGQATLGGLSPGSTYYFSWSGRWTRWGTRTPTRRR